MGQVLVLGVISGAIYGLFALGIVLVHRGSGALNFAQGEIGTLSLFAAWYLVTDQGWPWWTGAVAAIALAAVVGGGFERLVVRPMVEASRLAVAVATVGFLSFLLAVEYRLFSASPRVLRGPIEGLGRQVFGVYVSPTQMLSVGVVAVVGVGLALVLKRTDFGLGVLAAAEDPVAARLVGVPLGRVSVFIWATGAAVSALGALLIEPTVGVFVPGYASGLFLRGLAAAVVGGLNSLQGAFVGGLAVGILEAGAGRWLETESVPGVEEVAVLAIMLGVLLFRPGGLLGAREARA